MIGLLRGALCCFVEAGFVVVVPERANYVHEALDDELQFLGFGSAADGLLSVAPRDLQVSGVVSNRDVPVDARGLVLLHTGKIALNVAPKSLGTMLSAGGQ